MTERILLNVAYEGPHVDRFKSAETDARNAEGGDRLILSPERVFSNEGFVLKMKKKGGKG